MIVRRIGLGDLVARTTQAVGIKPCEPCKQRQAILNRVQIPVPALPVSRPITRR